MDIHVISIFPEMFKAITEHGVIARAIKQNVLSLNVYDPRDYALDKHNTVDDRPYGGGPGMVMAPDVMTKVLQGVLERVKQDALVKTASKALSPHSFDSNVSGDSPDLTAELDTRSKVCVIYLSPQGQQFNHRAALRFAELGLAKPGFAEGLPDHEVADGATKSLVFIAGRYEGIDERFIERFVDEEWSAGDYVLSGGELPAMIMIDAIARLLPRSLGNAQSAQQDSFVDGLLDCPHYTRPEKFEGESVPAVLLSGDHQAIKRWRLKQSLGRTWLRRPELLEDRKLTAEEIQLLEEFKAERSE